MSTSTTTTPPQPAPPPPQKPHLTSEEEEGGSLPIPVWTEQPQPQPRLISDDGLHVVGVARKPVPPTTPPVVVVDDGLHVVTHDDYSTDQAAPQPYYETPLSAGRCTVLPSRAAEWGVKGGSSSEGVIRLSTLAAAVLVREGVLDGRDVELIRLRRDADQQADADGELAAGDGEKIGGDAAAAVDRKKKMKKRASVLSSFSDISGVQRKASVAELKSYRRKLLLAADTTTMTTTGRRRVESGDDDDERQRSSDAARSVLSSNRNSTGALAVVESGSSRRSRSGSGSGPVVRVAHPRVTEKLNGAEKLDRSAEGVTSSGKSLARGINNLPRRYGDKTVRRDDEIVGVTSGLAAAGKGFGLGLYDGITGIFVRPVTGAQREGAKGFVKGCVKGVVGAVTKPAAGSFGLAGHTLVGISRSIEKSISRRPKEEECIAVASVWQGEEEMRSLTEQEKTAILDAWFAGSR